jgi:hypothetical protein
VCSCAKCIINSTLTWHVFQHNVQPKNGVYTVGDFMTKKDELQVVKPTTTVDEGIYLVEVSFWDNFFFSLLFLVVSLLVGIRFYI